MTGDGKPRCGFVALVGAPNAGKSTLLNRVVGAKIAIVTPKAQTTRTRVRGVATFGPSQVVFVDTPGIFKPRRRLDRAMVAAAWSGARDADVVTLLVDARARVNEDVRRIVDGLKKSGARAVLALNKIDLTAPAKLLKLAAGLNEALAFEQTFMISAMTGDGVDDLTRFLAGAVPAAAWLYPADQLTDLPERLIAAELTREKLFIKLRQELPYALTVETDSWREFDDGSVRIDQTVYLARGAHKGMVLGKGGALIKSVRETVQQELGRALGRKAHLFIFVKVRGDWGDDPERYRDWDLDFNA